MAQSALSADPRGLKRICLSCSTRFYDMNKRPIACPNCATEFTGEIKIKTRRGRLSASDLADDTPVQENAVEAKEDEDEEVVEVVSLEDVEREEEGDDADDDAVELDDDDDDDIEDDLDDDDDIEEEIDVNVDEEK